MAHLILDIATAPIDGAEQFLDSEEIVAPSNYKDPAKIDAYIAAEKVKRLEKAALDPDLCRITAIGYQRDSDAPYVRTLRSEDEERAILGILPLDDSYTIITFNGLKFDLPVLVRRCHYLSLETPTLNSDRFRTPHVDLYERLTHHGIVPAHNLAFYVKRLGWSDLFKPLSGADEARVPSTGRWDELKQSVEHDVIAVQRLATWMGVL